MARGDDSIKVSLLGKINVFITVVLWDSKAFYNRAARRECYKILAGIYRERRRFDLAAYCHERYEAFLPKIQLPFRTAGRHGLEQDLELLTR